MTVPPSFCRHHATFTLSVHCPDELWSQVEPALWAWVNFGGLGGRTRRGCGSLLCKTLAPRDHADLAEQLRRFAGRRPEVREWPTLVGEVLRCERSGNPVEVWGWLIGLFRRFRQGIDFARDPGPGRSRYPEPESIRTVLYDSRRPWRHDRLDHIPNDAFPRAELGLPIGFHFQGQGEPPDTNLYPSAGPDGKPRERMASPLILKPLALQDGRAIPLILRLKTPPLDGVDLRREERSLFLPASTAVRGPRLAAYPGSPLSRLSPDGSAIEAFLKFAADAGFAEVPR